ncbi:caspase family protein [Chondromyces crocatus]|uniref:Peptidase C14 caspase domain-containing protein n=1 Tax=Chondromyces crocatus TaxID=52 RepID=A0A0K1EC38_CHOCO|nr:caspase family protein [Chondromyces crocatus]AKT38242.1 uncharacterized protein CMC5_023850 [Chondromyces crocatus]
MTLEASPETTVVVITGASEWPEHSNFTAHKSFKNSAASFSEYLLNESNFGLPKDNLLDCFDTLFTPSEFDKQISSFIAERREALKNRGLSLSDLIFYYVGHGDFCGSLQDYYLALRTTRKDSESVTGLKIRDLAEALNRDAKFIRRYIILDSCFSAVAMSSFQTTAATLADRSLEQAFPAPVNSKSNGPVKGTALFCSSSSREASLAPPSEHYTVFSSALLEVLRNGHAAGPVLLSLGEVATLVEEKILSRPTGYPRPELHSPDQRQGDIGLIPLFPNAALQMTAAMRRIDKLSARVAALEDALKTLQQRNHSAETDLTIRCGVPATTSNVSKGEHPQSSDRTHDTFAVRVLARNGELSRLGSADSILGTADTALDRSTRSLNFTHLRRTFPELIRAEFLDSGVFPPIKLLTKPNIDSKDSTIEFDVSFDQTDHSGCVITIFILAPKSNEKGTVSIYVGAFANPGRHTPITPPADVLATLFEGEFDEPAIRLVVKQYILSLHVALTSASRTRPIEGETYAIVEV